MDGVPRRIGTALERREQPLVEARVQGFHLDERLEPPDRLERLVERGNGLPIREAERAHLLAAEVGNALRAIEQVVMMNEQGAVRRGVYIELNRVGALGPGGAERRERVFYFVARRAPVSDDERWAHIIPTA